MYYFDSKEFKNEIDLEMYLIIKYWNIHYETKIDISNKNVVSNILINKKEIAKELGRIDIGFFGFYYLTNNFIPSDVNSSLRNLEEVHLEIFSELNNIFVKDACDKEEFILPRGLGKSTVINKLLGAWTHCYKISRYTVVIGKKEDDAIGFIDSTKEFLKLPKIIDTFGILVEKSDDRVLNKQELELSNYTKLYAVGSGTSIRGTTYSCPEGVFRPSVILVDDFISKADILTDDAKRKVIDKYNSEILETGDKAIYRKDKKVKMATKFLVIGTPLAADDFINTIRNDAEFKVFHRSVMFDDPDKIFSSDLWLKYKSILLNIKDKDRLESAEKFYYLNISNMRFDTLWNDKYRPNELANSYFTKRLSFMQELMCDCENVGDVWVSKMAKMSYEKMLEHKLNKTILSIDQATSSKIKSDFTAMTVLSDCNGFYFVRKGSLHKFDSKTEFDKYIDEVEKKLIEYEDITHVVLEKNVYKGVDATEIEKRIANNPLLKRRKIKVITIYNTQNKDSRISTITEKINSGQIIFNEVDIEYNKQVSEFKGQEYTLHDDAIDSLEMAVNNIDSIYVKKRGTMTFSKR